MKQKETLLNSAGIDLNQTIDDFGDEHISSSHETPLREDAFEMDDDLKMELIENHFKGIMNILGLDLTDDSLKGTPRRVAKMFIKEVFSGLDPKNKPEVKLFQNKYRYNEMLVEKDITFFSHCEHHFVPIYGKAHVAYISNGSVIGLSKINRIVQYFAKRPQVQERLTVQIGNELKAALGTDDVAIILDADHMCVSSRGVRDTTSSTVTSFYSGQFENDPQKRNEFLKYISMAR
ncbi:GTP cyclohydrolase I FolE [uncultured Cyclobacterium sp.]|uniref:GTP cyclohydrolase I FolE n=1 Tax=uncultured Cyclobacterium sp. TaxID=453820 RepID=UPI0030EDBA77|tara:strand:+ start:76812 stop:77513 length:702 start_codon:yes stop_codon:yes gene_type:complete